MKRIKISTDLLSVFKTFTAKPIPPELTVESRSGDVSMLDELPNLGLAIVGSRFPQRRSIDLLEEALYELRNTDLIIISGFARGIDAKAHELAIEFGLRTIAILGSGIDTTYPRENLKLRHRILETGGLVISQFADDAKPLGFQFIHRNSLIAGFSKATWVVEAAEVSGTLNTAKWATDFNRDLYATSCFPKDHFYQGNVKLLNQKQTDRYAVAQAFFNVQSLSSSWSKLGENKSDAQEIFDFIPEAKIQKWVLELQALTNGECKVQALMNHASQQGLTLGRFYQLFEAEVAAGLLKHDTSGRVEIPNTRRLDS
jgi:DNA protecting protein DprA